MLNQDFVEDHSTLQGKRRLESNATLAPVIAKQKLCEEFPILVLFPEARG